MADVKFVSGLFAKFPHPKAPDFVKMKLSIKRADLGNWLRGETGEWINIDVKESKNGKLYCAVDDFVPQQQSQNMGQQQGGGYQNQGQNQGHQQQQRGNQQNSGGYQREYQEPQQRQDSQQNNQSPDDNFDDGIPF